MKVNRFLLPLNLQLFAEGDGEGAGASESNTGVEGAAAAGEQTQQTEGTATQTGADDQAAAEPGKQNNFEKAFAKRLADAQTKWEADQAEKFKDHDAYKKAAEYLQKTSGISDILTLKEEIELAELQERAEKEKVPASVLKRIDELEVKAAKADEMEATQKSLQEWQDFESNLKTFCEGKTIDGKAVDHKELWEYMHKEEIAKPEIAFKAMKADIVEAKLETAKTDAINEYLKSKQGTKTEGSTGAAAQTTPATGGGFKGAEQRAAERMRASREAQ